MLLFFYWLVYIFELYIYYIFAVRRRFVRIYHDNDHIMAVMIYVHHILKCTSCHKITVVVTGWAHCFQGFIYLLHSSYSWGLLDDKITRKRCESSGLKVFLKIAALKKWQNPWKIYVKDVIFIKIASCRL